MPDGYGTEAGGATHDSLDAVVVGSAWHWFDAPAALTEIARVLHGHGLLGVFATSAPSRSLS